MNLENRVFALTAGTEDEPKPLEIADNNQLDCRDIAQEIETLSVDLHAFDIRFEDLDRSSPRSEKTRSVCAAAVLTMLHNHFAFVQLTNTGKLPVRYLSKACNVPVKILDRHRNYIIAATVILAGDYPLMSEYVSYIKGVKRPHP